MAMSFPPSVERWRGLVAKYFPPHLVDKALWAIQHESGGNPGAVGDGGVARGLFQIQDNRNFPGRPDAAWLDNPENNIRYAAQQLGAASGDFGAWGEGTSYNGRPFGAFGNNQWPGSQGGGTSGGPGMPTYEDALAQYWELVQNPPSIDSDEYETWVAQVDQLGGLLSVLARDRSEGGSDPNDIATSDFQNRIQDAQLDLAYDSTNLQKAIADIDRFLSGKEESRSRASEIAEGQDLIRRWGTPDGKSSYSLADLGAGFASFADTLGIGANDPFINYTGTIRIDPEGDMARFDDEMGVTGPLPSLPSLISDPSGYPSAPGLSYGGGGDYAGPGGPVYVDNGPAGSSLGQNLIPGSGGGVIDDATAFALYGPGQPSGDPLGAALETEPRYAYSTYGKNAKPRPKYMPGWAFDYYGGAARR